MLSRHMRTGIFKRGQLDWGFLHLFWLSILLRGRFWLAALRFRGRNMHASTRPAVSINITPSQSATIGRESTAALPMRMNVNKMNFFYGPKQVLFDINLGIATSRVTALIGPSGCGKSTLLRTMNRMYETVRNARLDGEILLDGKNILAQDVTQLGGGGAGV